MDWRKLLFPPLWLMVLLVIACSLTLPFVFLKGMQQSISAYLVYAIAFYTLCVVTIFCVMVLPKEYRAIKQKCYENPLGKRFLTDRVFRAKISLSVSFLNLGQNRTTSSTAR